MSLVYHIKKKYSNSNTISEQKKIKKTLHSTLVYNNITSQPKKKKKKGMTRNLVYSNKLIINTLIR